jgi:hypothetical protein
LGVLAKAAHLHLDDSILESHSVFPKKSGEVTLYRCWML